MWELRITCDPTHYDKVCSLLNECFGDEVPTNNNHIFAVAEGQPFDEDIESHLHVYMQHSYKSESWIRKALQALDRSRKGNKLYSLKKSHENSPNYALKKVFEVAAVDPSKNNRMVYMKGNIPFTEYRNRYDSYLKQISKKQKKSEKEAKFRLILDYISDKLDCETDNIYQAQTDIIKLVIQYCKDEGHAMPSKSQMEVLVLTAISRLKWTDNYLLHFYKNALSFNFSSY